MLVLRQVGDESFLPTEINLVSPRAFVVVVAADGPSVAEFLLKGGNTRATSLSRFVKTRLFGWVTGIASAFCFATCFKRAISVISRRVELLGLSIVPFVVYDVVYA